MNFKSKTYRNKLLVGVSVGIIFCFVLFLSNIWVSQAFADFNKSNVDNGNINNIVDKEKSSLYRFLSQIDGVTDIEEFGSDFYQEKYMFNMKQPIDWNNPSKGSFKQRVMLGFNGFDKYNVLITEGYYFDDAVSNLQESSELTKHYNCNQINVEHRFFGESVPAGLSTKSTDTWEYLTTENEAKDLHRIYSALSKAFINKWIATGASKSGMTALLYGYYFPNDMNVYVPYVTPWCNFNDERAFDYIWNTIGEEKYGKEQAHKNRELLLNIVVDFYSHRDELRDKFVKESVPKLKYSDDYFGKERTPLILYDQYILNFVYSVWQEGKSFEVLQEIFDINWETEHDRKVTEMLQLISPISCVQENYEAMKNSSVFKASKTVSSTYSAKDSLIHFSNVDNMLFPYWLQTYCELGYFYYDFGYLRNTLTQRGIDKGPEIKQDEQDNLILKTSLDNNFLKKFTYDPTTHNNVNSWINTTNLKIMFIHGYSDPWYSMRIHYDENPQNIKMYISTNTAHDTEIEDLSVSDKADAWNTLDKWLVETPHNPDKPVSPSNDKQIDNISETAATNDNSTAYLPILFMIVLSSIFLCVRLSRDF